MKYLLLTHGVPASRRCAEPYAELSVSGELVDEAFLADPCLTSTVRKSHGSVTVTEGTYDATEEHLAAYVVVDCECRDRATQIAARLVGAGWTRVDVRPVMDTAGQEM